MNLPQLPGLDVDAGLRHCAGRESIYRRVLTAFYQHEAGFTEAFRTALNSGDREGAQRLAHSLRSAAASIGAQTISDQAQALEALLRGDAPAEQALQTADELAPALNTLVDGLRAFFTQAVV